MAKKLSLVFGTVFVLLGLLAFVDNGIVGSAGFFTTDFNHDLIHLLTGLVFLFVGLKKPESASKALRIFSIIYIIVAVLGFVLVPQGGSLFGLMLLTASDHILHLVLGVVIYVLASLSDRQKEVVENNTSPIS